MPLGRMLHSTIDGWNLLSLFHLRGCDLFIVADNLKDFPDIIDIHRVLQTSILSLITPHLSPVLLTLCDVATTATL